MSVQYKGKLEKDLANPIQANFFAGLTIEAFLVVDPIIESFPDVARVVWVSFRIFLIG